MKTTRNGILLISWSHVDLAFSHELAKHYGSNYLATRFTHHIDWNTNNRSYAKNLIHIFKQIWCLYFLGRNSTVILFGTNLCRLFFLLRLNRETYYIYNELPCLKNGLLMAYDKIIFKWAKNVYVSTSQRKELLAEKMFSTDNVAILENITFNQITKLEHKAKTGKKAILIGTIDYTRLGADANQKLNKIAENGGTIDVLPSSIVRSTVISNPNLNILEAIPHEKISPLLKKYDFGILSYSPVSLNNYYAAPLKLYEYVDAGLRVISLFENRGIDAVKHRYPALFVDNVTDDAVLVDDYISQRIEFLSAAINGNQKFVNQVVAGVKGEATKN
jgi:hypothetical protein